MKVFFVEDEFSVVRDFCDVLWEIDLDIEVMVILELVKEVIEWINLSMEFFDFGFFDI